MMNTSDSEKTGTQTTMKAVCVYCGSSDHVRPEYLAAAREAGTFLASQGLRIVYGAGSTGMMGAVADGALEAGGEVVGVIPVMFNTPVLAHTRLTTMEVVETIHVRKARMVELADGFIALPGGYGTFEELFEVLTWAQIGLHNKPVGLLNTGGYFDPLLALVEHALKEGFIYDEHRGMLLHAHNIEELLEKMKNHQYPSGTNRWLERQVEE